VSRTGRALAAGLTALALGGLTGCSSSDATGGGDQQLVVLAAASLTEAFTDLGASFEDANPGSTVTFSFGGSSSLVRQALDGAPADVLATASPTNMADAVDGAVTVGTPTVFARNSLALVVPKGNPASIVGLADLAQPDLRVVVCAAAVPCGAAAAQAFEAAGVTPSIDSAEQDVKAVLAKVSSGEADAGIVYVTDGASAADRVDMIDLPVSARIVTDYPIVGLTASANPEAAQRFIDLVTSPEGLAVLESYGFQAP
jgi:molybdate transport system substrate-binding protein